MGAVVAGSAAFLLRFRAWPEMAAGGYFIAHGMRLYEGVILPYTPLLLYCVAAAGKLLGFSALVFRGIMAVSMAGCGALLVAGVHRRATHHWLLPLTGLGVGVPLFCLMVVYTEGPALWPDPFMAPLLLAATLALERYESEGSRRWLAVGGLLLGVSLLVKQTAAGAALAILVWAWAGSRRGGLPKAALLAAWVFLPLAAFYSAWALLFRTTAHLRWTLLIPLGGHASEIRMPLTLGDVPEALVLFLPIGGLALLTRVLPGSKHLRSPAAWLALGCVGMAWPRWGLLHLSASIGILALLASRALVVTVAAVRYHTSRPIRTRKLLLLAVGGAVLVTHLGVVALGAGPFVADNWRGETYYWDDEATRRCAAMIRVRVCPGGSFFDFTAPWDTVYPLTSTTVPGDVYVNPVFWFFLNKEGLDERLVASLKLRPGTLILFREPGLTRATQTALYHYVTTETELVEQIDPQTSWRRVP